MKFKGRTNAREPQKWTLGHYGNKDYFYIYLKRKSGGVLHKVSVSARDVDLVSKYRWWLSERNSVECYFQGKHTYMHILILGRQRGLETDHINGNPSDNRRENLRMVEHRQNLRNLPRHRNGFLLGATKVGKKWQAQREGKYLGLFDTAEEAHKAYMSE